MGNNLNKVFKFVAWYFIITGLIFNVMIGIMIITGEFDNTESTTIKEGTLISKHENNTINKSSNDKKDTTMEIDEDEKNSEEGNNEKYINNKIKNGDLLTEREATTLNGEQLEMYIDNIFKKEIVLTNQLYLMDNEQRLQYFKRILDKDITLNSTQIKDLTNNERDKYLKMLLTTGRTRNPKALNWLTSSETEKYIKNKVIELTCAKMYNDWGQTIFDIDILNKSDKIIKYVTFEIKIFNSVGDPVRSSLLSDNNISYYELEGWIHPNKIGGLGHKFGNYYPDPPSKWTIGDIIIEYKDGTVYTVNSNWLKK